MTDQPTESQTGVPIPPKGSGGGSNKVVFIVLGVILFCFIAFGVVVTAGVYYVKNRGANIVKDIAKTQGVDVESFDADAESGKISIKTKSGELTSEVGKELPDDYPVDLLPVYNGVIESTSRLNISDAKNWTVLINTDDDLKQIDTKVKEDLLSHGWEIVMEQDSDEQRVKTAKKEGSTAMISFGPSRSDEGPAQQIRYHITQKQTKDENE